MTLSVLLPLPPYLPSHHRLPSLSFTNNPPPLVPSSTSSLSLSRLDLLMEFRANDEDSLRYSPPNLRASAFSKPAPSSRNGLGLSPPTPAAAETNPSPTPISAAAKTPSAADAASELRYFECLKNHAASIGGHVIDGCGEFMPSDDDSYRCAACDCHRNFHRKERARLPLLLPPPPACYHHPKKHFGFQSAAYGGRSLSGGTTTASSSEEQIDAVYAGAVAAHPSSMTVGSGKRFRTKFTAEQKEKMLGFAESVGWRLQKQDAAAIDQLCHEIGVRRKVFKVWMHNNKHSIWKQQVMLQQQPHEQLEQHQYPPQEQQ